MDIATIVLGGILLVVGLAFSIAPILNQVSHRRVLNRQQQNAVHDLRNQLTRIVESVRDLDFDYDTHKINDEVYIHQRKMLIGRGVSLLIRLDQVSQYDEQDQAIERMVAKRRKITDEAALDDLLEARIAARREMSS
jgi:hypothetical protein